MAMTTAFAPAERASQEELLRQHRKLVALPFVQDFLDAVPDLSVVLNTERQIVFANLAFVRFLESLRGVPLAGIDGSLSPAILGCRVGELVGCSHFLVDGDCGTTPYCRTCGAAQAMVASQQGHLEAIRECRMQIGQPGVNESALDLRVWSRPITVDGESFLVFSMVDISNEKRRETMERIFFHDVLNTAGGVKGLADLMVQVGMPEAGIREMAEMVAESADHLLEEISAQRALAAAEHHELHVAVAPLRSMDLVDQMVRHFHPYCTANGKTIVVEEPALGCDLASDPTLLRRVLTNLVKNALEASEAGGTVLLGTRPDGDSVCFTVQNTQVLPANVRMQIFNRSFSTKGSGRGLGTYSTKLLTERYLGGHVSFVSTPEDGTRFAVRLPRNGPVLEP